MNIREIALGYLEIGLRPLPLGSGGKPNKTWKAPDARKVPSWREYIQRSPTEAEIAAWFPEDADLNIGGAIPQGWLVVDLDGGDAGHEGAKRAEGLLLEAGITLPENAPRVRTGHGYHVYLRADADYPKIPGNKFLSDDGHKPFVEILTNGSQVVLPPSTHWETGERYAWEIEPDGPIPMAPNALLDRIRGMRETDGKAAAAKPGDKVPVENLLKGVEHGAIDNTCTQIAGHFIAKGLTAEATIDIIQSTFAQRCTQNGQPFIMPLSDIRRVVLSVAKTHAANHPDADQAPTKKFKELWAKHRLVLAASGHPIPNTDNVLRLLDGDDRLKNVIRYDEFLGKYLHLNGREWNDADTTMATIAFQRDYGLSRVGEDAVFKTLMMVARKNPVNEPKDWLEGLKWDGVKRLEEFFTACMGVAPNDYVKSASKNFWINMVARVYRPGCPSDNMVVLEGRQGIGKTKALEAIGGKWYTDMHHSITDKDFYGSLQGKLLIEIAELDAFSRAEVTRIKQVITCRVDRYREPYARTAQDFPRRCVFVGTTNEADYLKDATGGRRFWPIECRDIDVGYVRELREQLYAEAVVRFKAGETWHEMPWEATQEEQEKRLRVDEWENMIAHYIEGRIETTVKDVAQECLKIDPARIDYATQRRVTTALRRLRWTQDKGGRGRRRWVPLEANYALY